MVKQYTTNHVMRGKSIAFTGAHVFDVTATSDDGQSSTATVAADNEQSARTRLMAIQSTMRLVGQVVNFRSALVK